MRLAVGTLHHQHVTAPHLARFYRRAVLQAKVAGIDDRLPIGTAHLRLRRPQNVPSREQLQLILTELVRLPERQLDHVAPPRPLAVENGRRGRGYRLTMGAAVVAVPVRDERERLA